MLTTGALQLRTLIEAYRHGRIDAQSLLERVSSRIESEDHAINAFVVRDLARARDQARAADGRRRQGRSFGALDGLPVAVKDNIDVAGLPTSNGLGRAPLAARDAVVVQRLRAAGVVLLGKLNMHEAALGATTDNPHLGATQNPLRPGHTPGGSSGGSAAAVAAGFCHASLGTDTLGSVRLPAAYCGVVGYKPGPGVLDMRGIVPLDPGLDCVGPLATCVADVQALARVMADVSLIHAPLELDGMSLLLPAQLEGLPMQSAVRVGFELARRRLVAAGVRISIVDCPWLADCTRLRRAALAIIEQHAWQRFRTELEACPEHFSPLLRQMLDYGRRLPAQRRAEAEDALRLARSQVARVLGDDGVLLTPTTLQTAFSHDCAAPVSQADLTAAANVAGCAAISVPFWPSTASGDVDALPIGVQLMTPQGTDARLLAIASAVEMALGP
ncbi:MAG: amidase [Gammaproteobacteria bacterium]|nr:amidase [Gammaproteobacteria bacterium]